MIFDNVPETREAQRRKRMECGRAYSQGVHAFHQGVDANPYEGWQRSHLKQHSHQCLLWCRWLNGWLDEYLKKEAAGEGGQQN